MRYLVLGPGAVGGTIAGRLAQHGHEVNLIARGAHAAALRDRGLMLRDPIEAITLTLPVVERPSEVDWRPDDVVVLAVKTQDSASALAELAAVAPSSIAIVCAQNGVENERLALRQFGNVYGMCVMLPATHLEPGEVEASAAPVSGILDVGRYPHGTDTTVKAIASDFSASMFSSEAVPAIMRFKYAKLLMNLGNALQAACGAAARGGELYRRARAEGEDAFRAGGIDFASREEDLARRGDILKTAPIEGKPRGGGSSWQSLARGTGTIETDYLNGEIVRLGREHGVSTPVNVVLQQVANQLALRKAPPGSMSVEDLQRLVDQEGG